MALTITSPIGDITLDAAFGSDYQGDADVTEHPLELGADVADHFRPKQEQVQITGAVSDTPISAGARALIGQQKLNERTRAGDALAFLRRLREEGHLCTITDRRLSMADMVLSSLRVPRDPKTGSAVNFTATFRRIKTVQTQRVVVATEQRVNTKRDLVKLTPKPTPEATQNKTFLKRTADTDTGDAFLTGLGLR